MVSSSGWDIWGNTTHPNATVHAMTRGINIFHGVISYIRVTVQVLWVGIARHNGVRAEEAVNIRRTRLFEQFKKKKRAPPDRYPQRSNLF